jgi:hypothetical protein
MLNNPTPGQKVILSCCYIFRLNGILNAPFNWLPIPKLLQRKRYNHTKPLLEIVQQGEGVLWEKNYSLCSFMSTQSTLSKKLKYKILAAM